MLHGWTLDAVLIATTLFAVNFLVLWVLYQLTQNAPEITQLFKPFSETQDNNKGEGTPLVEGSSAGTPRGSLWAWCWSPRVRNVLMCGITITLLAASTLAQRWSLSGDRTFPYRASSAAFGIEFVKLLVVAPPLLLQLKMAQGPEELQKMLAIPRDVFMYFMIPATLFMFKNLISFTVIAKLGAGLGQEISQSSLIIFTAVGYDIIAAYNVAGSGFSRLVLPQKVGMALLFIACVLTLDLDVSDGEKSNTQASDGMFYAVLWGLLTSLGCLSTEVILKHRSESRGSYGAAQSFFLQTMVLCNFNAIASLVVWVIDVTWNDQSKHILHGWDYKMGYLITAAVSCSAASGYVLKFMGNITSSVLHTASIALVVILATILFGKQFHLFVSVSIFLVLLACFLIYYSGKPSEDTSPVRIDASDAPYGSMDHGDLETEGELTSMQYSPAAKTKHSERTSEKTEIPRTPVVQRASWHDGMAHDGVI